MDVLTFIVFFVVLGLLTYVVKETDNKYLYLLLAILTIIFSAYMLLSPTLTHTTCVNQVINETVSGNTTSYYNQIACHTSDIGNIIYVGLITMLIGVIMIYHYIEINTP